MSKKDDLLKMCVEPNTITVINNIINTREYEFYCYKVITNPFDRFDDALKTIKQSRKYDFNTVYTEKSIIITNGEFSSFEEKLEFESKLTKTANIVVLRTTHYPGIDKHITVKTIKNTNKLTESPNDLAKKKVSRHYEPGDVADLWRYFTESRDNNTKRLRAGNLREILAKFLSFMYDISTDEQNKDKNLEMLYVERDYVRDDFTAYNYAVSGIGEHSQYLIDNLEELKTAPWKQINTQILHRQMKAMDPKSLQTIRSIFK